MILGMEVPFHSADSVDWNYCFLPRSGHSNKTTSQPAGGTPTQDYASYSIIHTPPSSTYLFCRICEASPDDVEILELPTHGQVPILGLCITFPNSLFPYAYIYKNKACSEYDSVYVLYALQTNGTAYVLPLKTISSYTSCHFFKPNEFLQFDTKISPDCPLVTAAVASTSCLVVGRGDGTLRYFRFDKLLDEASVRVHELRKEKRSRWRNLISSDSPYKSVKELVIRDISGRNVLFVLHSDGHLRIWDLSTCVKLLSISLSAGAIVSHLCIEVRFGADACARMIGLVYLRTFSWGAREITIGSLPLGKGGRSFRSLLIWLNPMIGMNSFNVSKKKLIDMKLSKSKIWVLQEDGLWELDLSSLDHRRQHRYSLQEAFVSKQLFQVSDRCSDAFYQTICSTFSSKEQMIGFFSSIFSRRLLQPGVFNRNALCVTLSRYDKHWPYHEFQALSIHKLRKEILTVIEHEAVKGSPFSTFSCWKEFCLQYFFHWRVMTGPIALFIDSYSGAVGLIRKKNVSLFRSLGDSELLMYGTNFDKIFPPRCDFWVLENESIDNEILLRVHECIGFLSQQFYPAIQSDIFYELVGGALERSREDGVLCVQKALKCVSNTSISCISEVLGADFVWQKGLKDHKFSLSKFSFSLLQSVKFLCLKAKGWNLILDVLKRYLSFLVPQKLKLNMKNSDLDAGIGNMKIPIMVQATSQVARSMLESAFGILLLLSYLLEISSQVNMLPEDISRIQLDLIPMINDIIVEWLIIHLFTTMPSDLVSKQESSKLRIDENNKQKSQIIKRGSFEFTLAFVLAMDAREGCHYLSLSSLPSLNDFNNIVRHFISWMHRQSEEKPLYGIENTSELTQSLLRNGQYDAVEILLMIVDARSRCGKLFANIAHGECNLIHQLIECCIVAQPKAKYVDLPKITDCSSTDTNAGKKQVV